MKIKIILYNRATIQQSEIITLLFSGYLVLSGKNIAISRFASCNVSEP
jgi:hypothetical protein